MFFLSVTQRTNLAMTPMTVGRMQEDGKGATGYGRIVSNLGVLFAKDDNQRVLWPNTVTLSDDYFKSLMIHAVPLDEGALFLLKDSALELDLYAMLAERLHRISQAKVRSMKQRQLRK